MTPGRARRALGWAVLLLAITGLAPQQSSWDLFRRGWNAYQDGNWSEAEDFMRRAIQARATSSEDREPMASTRFREAYLPYFWLGLARYQLEDCNDALGIWEQSVAQGVVTVTEHYNELVDKSNECSIPIIGDDITAVETRIQDAQEAAGAIPPLRTDPYLSTAWATDARLGDAEDAADAGLQAAQGEVDDLLAQLAAAQNRLGDDDLRISLRDELATLRQRARTAYTTADDAVRGYEAIAAAAPGIRTALADEAGNLATLDGDADLVAGEIATLETRARIIRDRNDLPGVWSSDPRLEAQLDNAVQDLRDATTSVTDGRAASTVAAKTAAVTEARRLRDLARGALDDVDARLTEAIAEENERSTGPDNTGGATTTESGVDTTGAAPGANLDRSEPNDPNESEWSPPQELEDAVRAYLAGTEPQQIIQQLDGAEFPDDTSMAHANLLLGAARFTLYYLGGTTDAALLEQARGNLTECFRLDPDVVPPAQFYSAKFIGFYRQANPGAPG